MRFLLIATVLMGCSHFGHRGTTGPGTGGDGTGSGGSTETSTSGGTTSTTSAKNTKVEPEPEPDLYPLDEALADALSGPLTHIGTGPGFGLFRRNVCAYRNDKVIVVNIYCGNDKDAASIVVLSPTRGRVVIYGEAPGNIVKLKRPKYLSFKGESEPMSRKVGGVSLDWSFEQLAAWDEKRHKAYIGACAGGVEFKKPQGGCSSKLKKHEEEWKTRNQPFLDAPPEGWYEIIRDLSSRVKTDSKPWTK